MPKPMADETEEKYISRCMGDEHMTEKYPDNDQRVAVCYAYWDKKDAPDNPEDYSRDKPSDEDEPKKRGYNFARMTDVELFAAGTWNGLPFTESDLDGIVSAFDALNLSGRVPLKLGHDGPDARRDPLTQLAMGWVQSVRRVGDKLLGTIEVPDKVRSLFKDGYLKFVSIELLKDVKASTRKIPWVLDAVALLGTDQPAVGILGDLQSVTMARSELEFESCVSFARDDMRPFHSINGDTSDMSNDKTALQELSDKLLALSAQVNDLQTENRQLKNRDAEFAQTKARFERLQEENKRRDIQAHRDKVTGRIEAAVKSEDITPAARERFNKVYRVDDDGAVMTISIEDVEEFVRENPNPHKKKPRKHAFTSLSSPDADIPVDVPVDVEASMRVEAFLRQSGVKNPTDRDIQAAAVQMFKSNPELGARYKAAADAQYGK